MSSKDQTTTKGKLPSKDAVGICRPSPARHCHERTHQTLGQQRSFDSGYLCKASRKQKKAMDQFTAANTTQELIHNKANSRPPGVEPKVCMFACLPQQ